MHLVPYDKKLLFGKENVEEIKETVAEPIVEVSEDCTYDPIYSGSKIRWTLKEKGIPQATIAKKLGVSQSQFVNMLSGRRVLCEDTIKVIADIIGVSVEELTGCKCVESVKKEGDTMAAGVKINDLVGFKNKIRDWLSTRSMKTRDLSGLLGFDERDIRITRWFHGSENPTMSDLERICGIMGCEIGWLTGNDELEDLLDEPEWDPVEEVDAENEEKFEENTVETTEKPREFKDIIAEYMEEHGLSRKAFGSLVGIDTSTVCRWWVRGSLPSEKLLQRIIDATGLNFDGVKIYEGAGARRKNDKERVETVFAKNIKGYLNYSGLRQDELSNLIGCNRGSVYGWLNDGCIPGKTFLKAISDITGYSSEKLINEEIEWGDTFEQHVTPPVEVTCTQEINREKEFHVESSPIDIPVAPVVDEMALERQIDKKEYIEPVEDSIDMSHSYDRESSLDIDILKAEMYEDLVQRTRDEMMEDLRKELLRELKPQNPRQNVIDELKKAANTIYENAESIVGNVNGTGSLTVRIYLNPNEVPRVNVDYDIYF